MATLGNSADGSAPANGQASDGLSELRDSIAMILRRLDSQSGIIEGLRKSSRSDNPKDDAPGSKSEGLEARLKSLEEKDRLLSERESRMTQAQIQSGLAKALVKAGVGQVHAEDLAFNLVARTPAKFKLSDDGAVYVSEGDADALPAGQWAGLFTATDRGKAYLAPRNNPRIGNLDEGNAPAPTKTVTRADLEAGRVNIADMASGKVALVD